MKLVRRILANEYLVAGGIVFLAAVIGGVYYHSATAKGEQQDQVRFVAKSETRHARLLGDLAQRDQLLRGVVAYFNASNHVSEDEFAILSGRLLAEDSPMSICWHSADSADHFTGSRSSGNVPCAHFDPDEPSRITQGETPLVVLSQVATTKGEQQNGYASIVFGIEQLFARDPAHSLREYLVIKDDFLDTTTTYTLEKGRLELAMSSARTPDQADLSYMLADFGNVHFRYLASRLPSAKGASTEILIAACFLGFGLLSALYIRNLIRTRSRVEHEVAWRTAELTQFAYRTSHDLRGPLVTVGGLCRALREDIEEGYYDDLTMNAYRIEAHVGKLDELVGSILQLTQADLGTGCLEPVEFAELLEDIYGALTASYPDHGVAMEMDVQAEGTILLPLHRVARVLENLISNSVKYSNPEAGSPFVRTRISQVRDELKIEICDNGLGIPDQFQPQLYTMFDRYHPHVGVPGSGLGLSIVKKHIDQLGGQIGVDSSPEGTTFTIQFPCAQKEAA